MDVSVKNFEELFGAEIHCVIPIFQRPYVWNEEDQWEPLWEDIESTASDYLLQLQETGGDKTRAQGLTRRHFMGAIVLQQQQAPIGSPKLALVIDGQQRLTTIQLLLDAASDVCSDKDFDVQSNSLGRLVRNQQARDAERFKLWPSADNQASFVAALEKDQPSETVQETPVEDCHRYFKQSMDRWIDAGEQEYTRDARADALFITLYGLFELAVIELSERDDPYVIFETLNARGTPLTAGDLVQNYILQAAASGVEVARHEELFEELWKPLEEQYWRTEVRTGALIRSRLDVFLQYWLVSTVLQEVRFERVFPTFKDYAESQLQMDQAIEDIAKQIHHAARIYKGWDDYAVASQRGQFFRRGRMCGLGGMSPLLLYVDTQPREILTEAHRLQMFSDLESFLVRRALCRAITAGLNRISLEVMRRLGEESPPAWPDVLREHLASLQGSRRWPRDDEIADSLLARPLYGRVGQGRLRMVLAAIEYHKRRAMVFPPDATFNPDGLSIEHIMPRRWQQHWGTGSESQEFIDHRESAIDVIGNLTLVNAGLNSSISNGPWVAKRNAIAENSMLLINKDVTESNAWDESAIAQRGEKLVDAITDIWPRPNT